MKQSYYRLGEVNHRKDMYDEAQSSNFRIKAFTKDADAPIETTFTTLDVVQNGSSYTVVSDLTGICGPCKVIVAGYKEDKFITLDHRPYNGEAARLVLNGDADTIKVMAWNSIGGAVPFCKCEVITSW